MCVNAQFRTGNSCLHLRRLVVTTNAAWMRFVDERDNYGPGFRPIRRRATGLHRASPAAPRCAYTRYRFCANHEIAGIDTCLMQAYDQRHNKPSGPSTVDEPTKDCSVADASRAAATPTGCKRATASLLGWLSAFNCYLSIASFRARRVFLPVAPATASREHDRHTSCASLMDDLSEDLCDIQGLFARVCSLFVRIRVMLRAMAVLNRAKDCRSLFRAVLRDNRAVVSRMIAQNDQAIARIKRQLAKLWSQLDGRRL